MEVVWMRESLEGGLRGMKMGRVSAGRTRVTVNSTNKLGRLLRMAEKKMRERQRHVWTHPGMVHYDHGVEFANVGVG
jgi:hypothetical protein